MKRRHFLSLLTSLPLWGKIRPSLASDCNNLSQLPVPGLIQRIAPNFPVGFVSYSYVTVNGHVLPLPPPATWTATAIDRATKTITFTALPEDT